MAITKFRIDYGSAVPTEYQNYRVIKYEQPKLEVLKNGNYEEIKDEKIIEHILSIISENTPQLADYSHRQSNPETLKEFSDLVPLEATFANRFDGVIDDEHILVDAVCMDRELKDYFKELLNKCFSIVYGQALDTNESQNDEEFIAPQPDVDSFINHS